MSFIQNIQTVAKYESKLLKRSWFFKIFATLAILILTIFSISFLISDDNYYGWMAISIPSNIPYINLFLLNTGQAVIAIFLASDFLKRDKKLDTSEVFYVHSLSNAEYVIGKIWGNLRVFLLLNLIILVMTFAINLMVPGSSVDILSYFEYFLIISIPTLIYILGLSIFLMLILKNQALTFIVLLGYIGLTLFYIFDKFYYVFDYMVYSLPLMKSTVVGFTNYDVILNHRGIYLFAGMAFICFTISMFGRLPNSSRSRYPWIVCGALSLFGSLACGYHHVSTITKESNIRLLYTSINNKYVDVPKMTIDKYRIDVEQDPDIISAEATMNGTALKTSSLFCFCLNPGLTVDEVSVAGKPVKFKRDHQLVLVDFDKEVAQDDSLSVTMKYHGRVDNNFCYLDIPKEVLREEYSRFLMKVDKKYAFQTKEYLLFTPETYWYPRPGTAYSDETPDWQQSYFSYFDLSVRPLPGLIPLSQGEKRSEEEGVYSYTTDYPAQAISLTIGKYVQKSLEADSIQFSIWHLEGNDFFSAALDSIQDTIPHLVQEAKRNIERQMKFDYPFKRFALVEVPAQFQSYARAWSQGQETIQPEMIFFPEKGWEFYETNIERNAKNHIRWAKWSGRTIDEKEATMNAVNDFFQFFRQKESNHRITPGSRGSYNLTSEPNPYYSFPMFYNFRFNIFSSKWPVANRIIELYLQEKVHEDGWEREYNGISNNEKVNLLSRKHSFKTLLGDVENRELLDNIIGLRANEMFARSEMNVAMKVFRDSVYALLNRNSFRNIRFENMLDTLGTFSGVDIYAQTASWNDSIELPYFHIYQPEVTRVRYRGEEKYVLKLLLSNESDCDGIIHINTSVGNYWGDDPDPKANRKVELKARESKLVVTIWEEAPREVMINTMMSGNLPSFVRLPLKNIVRENRPLTDVEGDFVVVAADRKNPNEIIVDNSDPSLFILSKPAVMGLLPKLLDKVEDSKFEYAGVPYWRNPLQWTATTASGYYGDYVRSAYVIKNGDGSQTATWRVPLETPGLYDVYYWSYTSETRYNRRVEGEYRFKIKYGEEVEDAYLNLRNISGEWDLIGTYQFDTDTIDVVLTNESKIRKVTADAVKLIRRQ